jgi:phosphatidate cytidylyltransferase
VKDLLIRTATGISLIILVAGSILLGPVAFLLLITIIYLLGIRELDKLQPVTPLHASILLGLSGSALFLMVYLVFVHRVDPWWLLLPAGLWLAGYLSGSSSRFFLLALCWLCLPLALFFLLGWLWPAENTTYRPLLPLSVISLVWINDTFAYLTGTWFGAHRMTPVRSPGKTWEGFLGGTVCTLAGGWLVFLVTETYRPVVWMLLSLIITVFGLWGDLFESKLKRGRDMKNTGNLLPGHGGILDRFDSLLFVTPPVFIIILFIHHCFQ